MTRGKTTALKLKRVYEKAEPGDGCRVLVDRIWPRGVARKDARIDLWLKDVAPSTDLRKWFGHRPERWQEFKRRYFEELDASPEAVAELERALGKGSVTLVYAARDERFNNAVAIREYLSRHAGV